MLEAVKVAKFIAQKKTSNDNMLEVTKFKVKNSKMHNTSMLEVILRLCLFQTVNGI